MWSLLSVFPLLTIIISLPCFIYPFIVSKKSSLDLIITADSCIVHASRLILNLLPANCPLDESVDSRPMEPLMFYHPESNRNTEADDLQVDR